MKKKQKVILISLTLAAVAFFGIRYQVGQPIECAFLDGVTKKVRDREERLKETFWHKVFLTRSECRKIPKDEAVKAVQDRMFRPN